MLKVKLSNLKRGIDDKKTVQNGYFDDKDVKDRELSDWSGKWQSVYPYLQDGTLDQVFEYKSLLNKDKTAQEYKEYYTKGYQTDVSKIAIDGKKMTMTFTKNDGSSVTHTYRYDGYKILTYASGKKGVRISSQQLTVKQQIILTSMSNFLIIK